MSRPSLPLLFALLTSVASTVAAQRRDAFVLLVGNDTIAVERFVRSSTRLESELLFRAQNGRFTFSATLNPDGTVSRLDNAYRSADADRTGPPAQSAVFHFVGDSAIVDITTGGRVVTQRLKSVEGAIPFINPSFALMELVLARARRLGGDSVAVPAFAVQGGQVITFTVTHLDGDSVAIGASNASMHVAVNAGSDILGGVVAAQGLRIVRVRNAPESGLTVAPRDYSAPPDASYTAEEVAIPTTAGFTLAGTLTLPKDAPRPLAALVTITGSGLQDRDESLPIVAGYGLFRQIADTLSRHGIAVLRMDDRGYGASGGNAARATSADFADDIRSALTYLRGRADMDGRRLGLIGHSEGGIIAPMIAATDASLRGIVIMAGPSWTGRRIIQYQNRYLLEQSPDVVPAQRDSLLALSMHTVDSTSAGQPWMRYFLAYDPLVAARKVRVPVLILQGATDRQVTAEQAPELAAAIRSGGNSDVTLQVFPNTDHLFLADSTGNPLEYARLDTHTVRSEVLGAVVTWVQKHFR